MGNSSAASQIFYRCRFIFFYYFRFKLPFGHSAMYSSLQLAFKYLHYYLTASNGRGHGIHSPFVYDFVTKVLNDKTQYADYEKVEDIRRKSLRDKTVLTIEDYGAGS